MKYFIPKIEDCRLEELAARIKPLVINGGELFYIEPCDLRNTAFPWSPKFTVQAKDIICHARITTLHTFGYQGFFKPSIAEVLAQIPEIYLDNTIAFEVIGPNTVDDLNKQSDAVNAGFHMATTKLYGRL